MLADDLGEGVAGRVWVRRSMATGDDGAWPGIVRAHSGGFTIVLKVREVSAWELYFSGYYGFWTPIVGYPVTDVE